jgi:hypothetical protein
MGDVVNTMATLSVPVAFLLFLVQVIRIKKSRERASYFLDYSLLSVNTK